MSNIVKVEFKDLALANAYNTPICDKILRELTEMEEIQELVFRNLKYFRPTDLSDEQTILRQISQEIFYRMNGFNGYRETLKKINFLDVFEQVIVCFKWIKEKEKDDEEVLIKFKRSKTFRTTYIASIDFDNLENFFKETCSITLKDNRLSVIPKEFWNLKNLKSIDLGGNLLFNLPKEIANFNFLKTLYAINSKIIKIPQEIGQLQFLEELNLHSNNIESIPPEIGNLKNLKFLNLANNLLTDFPPEILQLSSLYLLNITRNSIKEIPEGISKLSSLFALYVNENRIEKLPFDLENMKSLQILDILNDPPFNRLRSEKFLSKHDFIEKRTNEIKENKLTNEDKILFIKILDFNARNI